MSKSNYLESALLDHVLRNATMTSPTSVYVALFSANPTETGSLVNELAGDGYARQVVTFSAPAAGSCSNDGIINFPEASGDWVTATHFAVCDAVSGGQVLYSEALDESKTIMTGETARIAAGSLVITED
jgi:hypothetical protein